jgi:hypothetical protein
MLCLFMLSCLIFKASVDLWDSEVASGPIWPSNFSVAFRERRFDEFLLIAPEGLCEKT